MRYEFYGSKNLNSDGRPIVCNAEIIKINYVQEINKINVVLINSLYAIPAISKPSVK